jgi:hypothetical protein
LKAGLAQPEETAVAKQWLFKHVSESTEAGRTVEKLLEKKHAKIELLDAVFSMRSAPSLYTGDRNGDAVTG